MREQLKHYVIELFNSVPSYVYEGLLFVFCVGIVVLALAKWKRVWKNIVFLLLIEYLFLIYSSTVFLRKISGERKVEIIPFWSYEKPDLYVEILMNVAVFIPVGILLGVILKSRKWWSVIIIGAGISISIEILQFSLKRGYLEFDDVMHNTLGCMIGYGVYILAKSGCQRFCKRGVRSLVET